MRDRDKDTPYNVEPRGQYMAEHQRDMVRYAGQLSAVRARLWTMHVEIGEQHRDEEMAEGTFPESLGYSMRGTIECVCEDHLDPAIKALEKAAKESHWDLVAEWCRRKGLPDPPRPSFPTGALNGR